MLQKASATGRAANPFVYGRVLSAADAACARPKYENAILDTVRNRGRLALVGDRRLGKSTLVERMLQAHHQPVLRWDFHKVLSVDDLIRRAAEDFDAFIRDLSPIRRRITPWLREIGVGIHEIRLSFQGTGAALRLKAPTDHLKRLLSYLAQLAAKRPFCLFIDELQDVRDRLPEREGEAMLGLLRSELQRLRIPCFFAGSFRESFRGLFMSESSPFFESARLIDVEPIPKKDFSVFLRKQFATGRFNLSEKCADLILSLGGDSPNDVQHLAHETWNFCLQKNVTPEAVDQALAKILGDVSAVGEAWLTILTQRQTRALLTAAFLENVGAASGEFLRLAGLNSTGAVDGALKPCAVARDPVVEKLGSRYRVRSRYLRLWLVSQRHLVQEMLPAFRDEAAYERALRAVSPLLPQDFGQE